MRLGDGQALALGPDGRWAIVHTGAPHLTVIPTGPGQPRRLERSGLRLLGARWLADGRTVVVRAAPENGAPCASRARWTSVLLPAQVRLQVPPPPEV